MDSISIPAVVSGGRAGAGCLIGSHVVQYVKITPNLAAGKTDAPVHILMLATTATLTTACHSHTTHLTQNKEKEMKKGLITHN
ncbi:hypothetical protein E2C01_024049 [Portunus trituberculatus]|uniref:Uncharacterized protein n=1 Tax=Portunus trituberculatus TaxID=210409 RepID=A0A5B7E9E3_PORTR|nr:hypothetical protein [Portunus trituberculatus]